MVTKDELMNYVPPQDVIDELNMFAEVAKKDIQIVKSAFYDTFTQPFLDGFVDLEERARQASKVLMAQVLNKVYKASSGVEINIKDNFMHIKDSENGQSYYFNIKHIACIEYNNKRYEKRVEDEISHEMVDIYTRFNNPIAMIHFDSGEILTLSETVSKKLKQKFDRFVEHIGVGE